MFMKPACFGWLFGGVDPTIEIESDTMFYYSTFIHCTNSNFLIG